MNFGKSTPKDLGIVRDGAGREDASEWFWFIVLETFSRLPRLFGLFWVWNDSIVRHSVWWNQYMMYVYELLNQCSMVNELFLIILWFIVVGHNKRPLRKSIAMVEWNNGIIHSWSMHRTGRDVHKEARGMVAWLGAVKFICNKSFYLKILWINFHLRHKLHSRYLPARMLPSIKKKKSKEKLIPRLDIFI